MPLRIGDALPSLTGASAWYNSQVGEPTIAPGPVLIHFWAVSCYLCKNNLPTIQTWKKEYGPLGLQVIAVHMPRQETDTDAAQVQALIAELGIAEPCALDNEHALKDAFKNEQGWVPAYFLFDADHKLKVRAAGEAGLGMLRTGLARIFPSDEPGLSA